MTVSGQPPDLETDQPTRNKLLKRVTNLSLSITILLVFIKVIAWYKPGSVAMLGSLLDSILDTVAVAVINLLFIRSALRSSQY